MKNVLNIVPYPFLPYYSGGQKLIALFNQFLGEQCELHVAGTVENEAALAKNYTFHSLLGKKNKVRFINLSSYFKLKKLVEEKRIDTVIIEHPYLGWMGWLLKLTCKTKLIIHTHNVEHERFRTVGKWWWSFLKLYETWVLNKADYIFCISEEDRQWMIDKMQIPESKCLLVPYGITQQELPPDKKECKEKVCSIHGFNPTHYLFFFNGLLDYKPNTDAVTTIIEKINPVLFAKNSPYNILIAGKRLPESFKELKAYNQQHLFYAGFVDDIDLYTKAADVLLNPINSGGGVKTKMIEALGMNTAVVATETGATGVNKQVCGDKLKIVSDNDWAAFADEVLEAAVTDTNIPTTFYQTYYWGNIIQQIKNL
jgi:polysaccharide biosynthesis protein PslH